MSIDRNEYPFFLNDYVTHLSVVKCLSKGTVQGYFRDVRQFLRFYMQGREHSARTQETMELVSIREMTVDDLKAAYILRYCNNDGLTTTHPTGAALP